MKFHKTILTLLAVTLAVIGTTATVVHAEGPVVNYDDSEVVMGLLAELSNSPNPVAALQELPPEAQQAVIYASTPVSEGSEIIVTDAQMSSGGSYWCRNHIRKKYKRSPLGFRLATFISKTHWCYDGSVVINGTPHLELDYATHNPFWSFVGIEYTNESYGPGDVWHRDTATAHFKACLLVNPICTNSWHPTINKKHFGTGSQMSW